MNSTELTSYDLMNESHTGETIYLWCTKQVINTTDELTVARLILEGYWGKKKIYPRKDVFYTISPLMYDQDGDFIVKLYRDLVKSPRPVTE